MGKPAFPKTNQLRAMREARWTEQQKRQPKPRARRQTTKRKAKRK